MAELWLLGLGSSRSTDAGIPTTMASADDFGESGPHVLDEAAAWLRRAGHLDGAPQDPAFEERAWTQLWRAACCLAGARLRRPTEDPDVEDMAQLSITKVRAHLVRNAAEEQPLQGAGLARLLAASIRNLAIDRSRRQKTDARRKDGLVARLDGDTTQPRAPGEADRLYEALDRLWQRNPQRARAVRYLLEELSGVEACAREGLEPTKRNQDRLAKRRERGLKDLRELLGAPSGHPGASGNPDGGD